MTPLTLTVIFPSVKLAVAMPDTAPVALTAYVATNQSGRVNESEIWPPASATTSTFRLQLLPTSSFTKMCTASPAYQFEPVSVTVPPGG